MTELERTRQEDSEAIELDEHERILAALQELEDRPLTHSSVIKGSEREYELCRNGYVKWFINPYGRSTLLSEWIYFLRKIPNYTGRHTHQGGLFLFILEGRGYTVADGVRYDWKKDDFVMLPIKPEGVEHQHFNVDPDGPSVFLAAYYLPLWNELAGRVEQNENDPHWSAQQGL